MAGEVTQWVKYLLHKHEDLSSVPRTMYKLHKDCNPCSFNRLGDRDRKILRFGKSAINNKRPCLVQGRR